VILDLPVAHRTLLVRVVQNQRPQQELPVRRDARGTEAADESQVLAALLVVRGGQDPAVGGEPFAAPQAVAAAAIVVPVRRIGAAETVERVLYLSQVEIVGGDLDDEDDDVDVVEEVQVEVNDVEAQRRSLSLKLIRTCATSSRRKTRIGDPPCCGLPSSPPPFAVEKALHVGQEGDELAVVTFLELLGIAGELVASSRHGWLG
jgi:hypothetical protein